MKAAFTALVLVIAFVAVIAFGRVGLPGAQASGLLNDSTATTRARIPRLTLAVKAIRFGGKDRTLLVTFNTKQRFRYNSTPHLYRIEKHYRPRKAVIRFMGRSYRLKLMNTLLPEMAWAFTVSSKRPDRLACKVGTHPRATIKFRNIAGKFTRKIRVGCRKQSG